MRILLCAGEVSGDVAGAALARELARVAPSAELHGLGGSRMAAAGVTLVSDTSRFGAVGLTEAMAVAPALTRAWLALRRHIDQHRPDVAVLIANDLFNALLARWLRRQGIPTVGWFPPQVWVWRVLSGVMARSVDTMLTVFPDETDVYGPRRRGPTHFVGHYLAETLTPRTESEITASRTRLGLPADARVVGLLPGSRGHEVRLLLPTLLEAARTLLRARPSLRFVLPVADPKQREAIDAMLTDGLPVAVVDDSLAAMRAADVLLLSSGTATLEATLLRVPMVIVYRVSGLTYGTIRSCIATGLIESRTVGLPNLILKEMAVPELLQYDMTPDSVAGEATRLLDDEVARRHQLTRLSAAAARVSADGSIASTAAHVLRATGYDERLRAAG